VSVRTYQTASAAGIRTDILRRVAAATDTGAGFWYGVSSEGRLERIVVLGSATVERRLSQFLGGSLPEGAAPTRSTRTLEARRGAWALQSVPERLRTRFRGLHDDFRSREAFEALPVHSRFYGPCHISDQLRLLPFRGGRFLGWIGVVREDGARFTPRAREAADALTPDIEDALAAARAIESIGDGAFLVARPCGAIEQASAPVERWLDGERAALIASVVREVDRGESHQCGIDGVSLRFVRLDGAGGVRYLATLSDVPQPRLSGAARLTPAEHVVATAAAAGLSVPEISAAHRLSTNTIKAHIKSAYRKLDVSSRLELAAALDADETAERT
jgi:DNA-binding CsgD family transcriptional regulator